MNTSFWIPFVCGLTSLGHANCLADASTRHSRRPKRPRTWICRNRVSVVATDPELGRDVAGRSVSGQRVQIGDQAAHLLRGKQRPRQLAAIHRFQHARAVVPPRGDHGNIRVAFGSLSQSWGRQPFDSSGQEARSSSANAFLPLAASPDPSKYGRSQMYPRICRISSEDNWGGCFMAAWFFHMSAATSVMV